MAHLQSLVQPGYQSPVQPVLRWLSNRRLMAQQGDIQTQHDSCHSSLPPEAPCCAPPQDKDVGTADFLQPCTQQAYAGLPVRSVAPFYTDLAQQKLTQGCCTGGLMDSLVLRLASQLTLRDLQALSQTSRLLRQAVQALPAQAWQCSAARELPAYHPLAAGHTADVPATANSFCSAASAMSSGRITTQSASFAGTEALLLQPDFMRALVMHDGTMELVEAADVMQRRSRRASKRKRGQQLPGAACHFDDCSPCGRFCLLRVHHASEQASIDRAPVYSRREMVCWDVAAGEVAGTLLSEETSEQCDDSKLRTWNWLPNSTVLLSDCAGDRLSVFSAQGQLLGSTPVLHPFKGHDEAQGDDDAWPDFFTVSTSGRFLAGQNGTCLAIFTAPECCLYLELGDVPYILPPSRPCNHIWELWWSPHDKFLLCNSTGDGGFSMCSLAGKCWLELQQPPGVVDEGWGLIYPYAWIPQGLIGFYNLWERDNPMEEEITACIELSSSSSPRRLDERLQFKSEDPNSCVRRSPYFRWLAISHRNTLHIVCCRTLAVRASVSLQGVPRESSLATSMAALQILASDSRPLTMLRFS